MHFYIPPKRRPFESPTALFSDSLRTEGGSPSYRQMLYWKLGEGKGKGRVPKDEIARKPPGEGVTRRTTVSESMEALDTMLARQSKRLAMLRRGHQITAAQFEEMAQNLWKRYRNVYGSLLDYAATGNAMGAYSLTNLFAETIAKSEAFKKYYEMYGAGSGQRKGPKGSAAQIPPKKMSKLRAAMKDKEPNEAAPRKMAKPTEKGIRLAGEEIRRLERNIPALEKIKGVLGVPEALERQKKRLCQLKDYRNGQLPEDEVAAAFEAKQ